MLRSLLSAKLLAAKLLAAFSLAAFLCVSLAIPVHVEARRCGEKPPETLLSLYRNSTSIHIGTYDGTIDVGMTEDTEDYSIVQTERKFTLSSTRKGEAIKFFNAKETDYRYKGEEDTEYSEEEEYEYGHAELKEGDAVMIFLKRDEETGEIGLADYRDAVKQLSPEQMTAYERRVIELNGIFTDGKASDQAIVNWLVDITADPLTRWEGAFELLSSMETGEWKAERAKYIAEKIARGEKLEEWELDENYDDSEYPTFDNTAYAKLLTDAQKQELMQMLLERKPAEEGDESKQSAEKGMDEGDRALMQLVRRWGDSRLAEFLIAELRNSTEVPYLKYELMSTIAEVLGDEKIRTIAGRYVDIYQQDDETVEIEVADEIHPMELEGERVPVESGKNIDGDDTEAEIVTRKITYGELRAELLADFISKSEQILTTRK